VKSKSLGHAPRLRAARLLAAALLALGALFAPGMTAGALADFTASPSTGVAPLPVTFTDGTQGSTSSSWDFGDNTSADTNPATHVYGSAGIYHVTLTSSDGVNPPQIFKQDITVLPPAPVSQFTSKAATSAGPHAVAFTDTSAGGATAWQWNFGDAAGVQSTLKNPTHAYAAPGTYTVTLRACNAGGCDATPFQASVAAPDRAPMASFAIFSTPAAKDSQVAFDASASSDPDGDPISYTWDLDGNGVFGDATGVTAFTAFSTLGNHLVRLQVSDGVKLSTVRGQTVTVVDDRPPVAGFSFTPTSPSIGQNVVFTSSSTDPDGAIVKLEWDLDNDGQFDDAQGAVAQWSFATPGPRFVSLRATDDKGVATIAFQTVNVTGPPAQPPPSSTPAASPPAPAPSSGQSTKPALLNPFPIIHLRARIIGGSIRIDLLSVKAPSGATVQVRCKGRRCPAKTLRERVRSGAKAVRFKKLERRLRAGTVLQIYVTKRGSIGKYTRFVFRTGKAPSRRDLCLPAGSMRPGRCPVP
jgi:PKD repeat protein